MIWIVLGGVLGVVAAELFWWSIMWLTVQFFADKREPEGSLKGITG